jgi:outer membrane lipoprotein-sorting protein
MPTQSSKILRYAGLALLPFTFLLAASAQEGGLSVDDIVKKNVDARGGIDKIKAIQSIKMSGKMVMGGGQMEAPMTLQMKRPSSVRIDMEFQGQAVVQGYDGETAWTINPFTGGAEAQKMSADEAGDLKENADMEGTLIDYKAKGHKIELAGKEDVTGKPAYKLKVAKKNGKTETIYVDAASFLEVKTVAMRKMMGNDVEMETFTTDYRPVGGVLMAFSIDSKAEGNSVMALTLEKVEANVPVDDALFKMPAAK